MYFLGLIDVLTQYDTRKKAAHAAKAVKHGVRRQGLLSWTWFGMCNRWASVCCRRDQKCQPSTQISTPSVSWSSSVRSSPRLRSLIPFLSCNMLGRPRRNQFGLNRFVSWLGSWAASSCSPLWSHVPIYIFQPPPVSVLLCFCRNVTTCP